MDGAAFDLDEAGAGEFAEDAGEVFWVRLSREAIVPAGGQAQRHLPSDPVAVTLLFAQQIADHAVAARTQRVARRRPSADAVAGPGRR